MLCGSPLLTSKNRIRKSPSLKRSGIWFRGIWISPFTTGGNQREGKGQDKAWWEVDSIVSGSYDGDTFVRRGTGPPCPARTSQSGVTHPPTAIYSEARPEMALWATWEDRLSRKRAGSLPLK